MAFGTPRTGTVAYSANNGTVVGPAIVGPVAADDILLIIVGQKPSTANGGTVTPRTTAGAWTLREELTAAGGYGTTLGADTGNTNIRIYSKDVVNALIAGGTDQFLFDLGQNNVSWAFVVHIPTNGSTSYSVGVADGSRTTAPTSGTPFTVNLTNGSPATDFETGDLAIWAMCIPTDVTTPNQFSARSIAASGATFSTATEFNEPDSGTGNDIGGYSAYATVTSGSSTAAPSITATATGTVTNVRGPVAVIRLRDTTQFLTPSRFDNTNQFFTPTVTRGAVTLTQNARFNNGNTFYSPDVTQTGGVQTLNPSLYTNTNTFYTATVTSTYTLTPARYDNTNTFFAPTVNRGAITLSPALYDNTNTFYTATVTRGAVTLAPALYTNTNTFYTATVTTTKTLTPARYDNTNTFYTATVTSTYTLAPARYDNTNVFYSATITQVGAVELLPELYVNTNTFYSPTVTRGAVTLAPARYDNTNSFYTPTVTAGAVTLTPALFTNTNSFYSATVVRGTVTLTPARYDNTNSFYSPTITEEQSLLPARYDNTNSFYTATVTRGAVTLTPSLYTNSNSFYSPTITTTGADQTLTQTARLDNTNTFYPASAQALYTLRFEDYVDPGYVDPGYIGLAVENTQVWYTPAITTGPVTLSPSRYDNTNIFYTARIVGVISPALYTNTNTIYPPSVGFILRPPLFENVNVFYPVQVIAAQILPAPPDQREQMPLETIARPGANWRPVGGPRQTMQIGTVGRQQMPITNYPRQPNPDA